MAIVRALRSDHGMVQYFQGAAPGDLLFSEHEIHQLETFTLQEALPIGTEHEAGTE